MTTKIALLAATLILGPVAASAQAPARDTAVQAVRADDEHLDDDDGPDLGWLGLLGLAGLLGLRRRETTRVVTRPDSPSR